jgi:Reverse transcriptase (RNA-dependent DNA polymerase)
VAIVHNDMVRSEDQRQLTALVLWGLNAAFDTVDHRCLLNVLQQRFAVYSSALQWFRFYLSDRTQTFIVGDDRSATYSVSCSVPQRPVLGPADFIAYTEDVVDVYNRHQVAHHMFADDQQLYLHTTISSAAVAKGRLLACINDIRIWCAARRLPLNADKRI